MSDSKPSNPKDALGIAKAPLSCVPVNVVAELGVAMMEGSLKYGRYNYREVDVRASVYFDAAIRHLFAWWEGEDIDPDSGMSHVIKAMASLTVLRDGMQQSGFTDDRPKVHTKLKYAELNKRAEALLEKYPPKTKQVDVATCPYIIPGGGAVFRCSTPTNAPCGFCDEHCGHARGICAGYKPAP